MSYFENPAEIWDSKKCSRMVKYLAKDGLGTDYPFKGYIGNFTEYGIIKYNGGCVRNGKWYRGEIKPLPIVSNNYKIVKVVNWGYKIVKC